MDFNSDDMLSSPDPLHDSAIFTSPKKTRRRTSSKRRARTSLPMNSSSPNKQTFELAVGSEISPQKLFVTVEAAHSDPDASYPRSARREIVLPSPYRADVSPSRRRERTTTTTIPLRGLSDTEDAGPGSSAKAATPKRGRGRPRKSGTPIPKRTSGGRRTIQNFDNDDDDDENIWDLGFVDGVTPAGKGKGRSRSRSRSTAKKGPSKKAKANPRSSQGNAPDGITPKKGRGRPKKLRQDEPAALDNEDEDYEQIDMETSHNLMPDATSADIENFGTIRSNATIEDGDADSDNSEVLLARFDENMQTPKEKGWSSPRGVSSGRPRISKKNPPEDNENWNEDDAVDDLQQAGDEGFEGQMDYNSDSESYHGSSGMGLPRSDSEEADAQESQDGKEMENEEDYDGSEADDDVGELREFDTIMESEDFSMISVDSLREHLSPPNNDQNTGQVSNSVGGVLLSAKQGVVEDSFSTIAQSVLDAASPIKEQPPLQAFRGQHLTQQEDSFSSIAPSVLEAASPIKGNHLDKQDDSTPKAVPTKFGSPALSSQPLEPKRVQQESQKTPVGNANISQSSREEEIVEPQSGVDENVLEAAADTDMISPSPIGPADNSPRPPSSRRSSHWSGLATPRESTSPVHESVHDNSTHSIPERGVSEMNDENEDQDVHMDSSPPPYVNSPLSQQLPQEIPQDNPEEMPGRYTYSAHIREQRMMQSDMIETPSIVFSSPTLPAINQQAATAITVQLAPNATTSSSRRPSLAPITRAGQVLQDVVVVPSSPRTRSQSLGSPFASPFKNRGGSGTPGGELANTGGQSQPLNGRRLSDFNLFDNPSDSTRRDLQESWSQGADLGREQRPSSSRSAVDENDDPFRNDTQSTVDRGRYSLSLPSEGRVPYPKLKSSQVHKEDSERWKPQQSSISEDVAASQPTVDHSVHMTDAPETHARRLEREWACERNAVSQQIHAASTSQVIVLSSEINDTTELPNEQDDDGDIDIWQDEARSSSSIIEGENGEQSSSAAKPASKQTITEKPRRSKIPSPWRKDSRRLVYSDELAEMSSPKEPHRTNSTRENSDKQTERPLSEQRPVAHESSHLDQDSQEFTGIWQMQMPQIPQKANFNPRPRTQVSRLEFSAFLEPSPRKSLPTPVTSEAPGSSKDPTSQRKSSQYSSPLVRAAKNRLNVSPPKALPSSPLANTDNVEYDQDHYLSPHNENFGSDADWPDDMSTPARSATTSKSKSSSKKSLSPMRSAVQKSMSSNLKPSQSTPKSQPEVIQKSPYLSTTEWSKTHWKILDKILQNAKPLEDREVYSLGNMFVKEAYFVGFEVERNEEGFATSEILGKEVYVGEKESMLLEQWHLEIIAIFREVVGFDDERALAKRLFGLIGAEARRRNRVKAEGEALEKAKGKGKLAV